MICCSLGSVIVSGAVGGVFWGCWWFTCFCVGCRCGLVFREFFCGFGVCSTLFWLGVLWVVLGGRVRVRFVPCNADIEFLSITNSDGLFNINLIEDYLLNLQWSKSNARAGFLV